MTITEFILARVAEDELAAYDLMGEREGDRALAECAAKRAITDGWEDPSDGGPWVGDVDAGYVLATDRAVRALAAVYKYRPDYRREWAA